MSYTTQMDAARKGIIASRIGAHAGDIAKRIPGARDWDDDMSRARAALDWEKMFSLAMDPEKPKDYRHSSKYCKDVFPLAFNASARRSSHALSNLPVRMASRFNRNRSTA